MTVQTIPEWALNLATKSLKKKRRQRYLSNREAELLIAGLQYKRYCRENEDKIAARAERVKEARKANAIKHPQIFAVIRKPGFREWYEAETGLGWFEDWEAVEDDPLAFGGAPALCGAAYHLKWLFEQKQYRLQEKKVFGEELAKMPASKRRQAIMAFAAPEWRDRKAIRKIYKARDLLNKQFPEYAPFHVDHIVPIGGKKVTGLHVAENLRVIPAAENIKKNNKWSDDMLTDLECWSILVK